MTEHQIQLNISVRQIEKFQQYKYLSTSRKDYNDKSAEINVRIETIHVCQEVRTSHTKNKCF